MAKYEDKLFTFIDVETTGLRAESGWILELGCVVTDHNLDVLCSKSILAPVSGLKLSDMSSTVVDMHSRSGLLAELREEEEESSESPMHLANSVATKLHELSNTVSQLHVEYEQEFWTAAGFSVHFDIKWLTVHWPKFAAKFSHRVLDVSTLKKAIAWSPDYTPPGSTGPAEHRALRDCYAAIKAARSIMQHMQRSQLTSDRCKKCGAHTEPTESCSVCINCGEVYAA